MSTLKVDAIRHNSATSDAITTAADGTCTARITGVTGGGALSHRNKARNGAMRISQRGTTFSPTTSDMYLIDGWMTQHGSSGNLDCTVTQSTDAPAGFTKSLKITPDSTNTPSGSQNGMLAQRLEGQDLQDLAFGTSDAKTMTVSWYAKTSATGAGNYTVKVEYNNGTNNYAVNKLFAFTTTWTRYTYTIPATGTATSVGPVDSNALGFRIEYHLFAGPDDVHSQFTQWTVNPSPTYKVISGQKNFMDNTNNELYITGLQIEVGDTATTFEHKRFSDELRDCQRYFQKSYNYDDAVGSSGVQGWFQWRRDGGNRPHIPMMTSMRSTPTFVAYNYVGGTGGQFRNASNGTNHAQGSVNVIGQNIVSFDAGATGWNQIGTGEVGFMYYSLESEL